MPTENFNLPLIADNMANDVVRDMNALAEATDGALKTMSDGKVDKVNGKQLSTNDYTSTEKTKLAGIASGANNTTVINTLTNTSTASALSAAQGKALKDLVDSKASNTDLTSLNNRVTTHLYDSKRYTVLSVVNQGIANATLSKLNFSSISHMHGANFVTNNNGDLSFKKGLYLAILAVTFASHGTGHRRISLPGTEQTTSAYALGTAQLTIPALFEITEDNTVHTFRVYQDSGDVLVVTLAEAKIYKVGDIQ